MVEYEYTSLIYTFLHMSALKTVTFYIRRVKTVDWRRAPIDVFWKSRCLPKYRRELEASEAQTDRQSGKRFP
jgi:hypothetical protein